MEINPEGSYIVSGEQLCQALADREDAARLRALFACDTCSGQGWYQIQSGDPIACDPCHAERKALGIDG